MQMGVGWVFQDCRIWTDGQTQRQTIFLVFCYCLLLFFVFAFRSGCISSSFYILIYLV